MIQSNFFRSDKVLKEFSALDFFAEELMIPILCCLKVQTSY